MQSYVQVTLVAYLHAKKPNKHIFYAYDTSSIDLDCQIFFKGGALKLVWLRKRWELGFPSRHLENPIDFLSSYKIYFASSLLGIFLKMSTVDTCPAEEASGFLKLVGKNNILRDKAPHATANSI